MGQGGKKYTLENDQLTIPDISPNPIGSFSDDKNEPGSVVFTTASGRPSGNLRYDSISKSYSIYNNDTGVSIEAKDGLVITDLEVAKKYFISTITHKNSSNGGPNYDLFSSKSIDETAGSIVASLSVDTTTEDFNRTSDVIKNVKNSRLAYLGNPTAENKEAYKKAAKALIDLQYEIDPSSAKRLKFTDYRLPARDVAELNLHIQKQVKEAPNTPLTQSVDQEYDVVLSKIKNGFDKKVITDPTVRELSKDGKYESLSDQMERNYHSLKYNFIEAGYDPVVASTLAKSKTIDLYTKRLSDGNRISLEFKSDMNDVVVLYFDKDFNPVASDKDVIRLRNALTQVRRSGLATKDATKFTLAGENSKAPGMSQIGDDDQAFSFPGGGVTLLVDRINKSIDEISGKPNWFSTDTNDVDSVFNHIVAHESGHILQYSEWGNQASGDSGVDALEADFKAKGLSTSDTVSDYGKQSFAEYFAESYAKYLLTGEASDLFKELLADKGLLRRDPSKWESSLSDEELEVYEVFKKVENYPGLPHTNPNLSDAEKASIARKRNAVVTYEVVSLFGNISEGATWISKDEIDPSVPLLFRGVKPEGGKGSIDMQEDFVNDPEPWVGNGIFGNGWYTSTSWAEAGSYSSKGYDISSRDDAVNEPEMWTLQPKPTAKIANNTDKEFRNKRYSFYDKFIDLAVKTLMERDGYSLSEAKSKARALWDSSPLNLMGDTEYSVVLGYDGITLEQEISPDPTTQRRTKVVIMNRSAFNIVDKRGKANG